MPRTRTHGSQAMQDMSLMFKLRVLRLIALQIQGDLMRGRGRAMRVRMAAEIAMGRAAPEAYNLLDAAVAPYAWAAQFAEPLAPDAASVSAADLERV